MSQRWMHAGHLIVMEGWQPSYHLQSHHRHRLSEARSVAGQPHPLPSALTNCSKPMHAPTAHLIQLSEASSADFLANPPSTAANCVQAPSVHPRADGLFLDGVGRLCENYHSCISATIPTHTACTAYCWPARCLSAALGVGEALRHLLTQIVMWANSQSTSAPARLSVSG